MNKPQRGRKPSVMTFDKKQEITPEYSHIEENIILFLPIATSDIKKTSSDTGWRGAERILHEIPSIPCPSNDLATIEDVTGDNTRGITEKKTRDKYRKTHKEHDPTRNSYIKKTIDNIHVLPLDMSISRFEKLKQMKTDISCWWCCHQFSTFPVYAPVKYDHRTEIFKVTGCFCSFECSFSYSFNDKSISDKSLVKFMYRTLTGSRKILKRSPPKEVLTMFGGSMSIDEYRDSFNFMDVKINTYPLVYRPFQIETKEINNMIDDSVGIINNNKDMKISLARPLKKRKESETAQVTDIFSKNNKYSKSISVSKYISNIKKTTETYKVKKEEASKKSIKNILGIS